MFIMAIITITMITTAIITTMTTAGRMMAKTMTRVSSVCMCTTMPVVQAL